MWPDVGGKDKGKAFLSFQKGISYLELCFDSKSIWEYFYMFIFLRDPGNSHKQKARGSTTANLSICWPTTQHQSLEKTTRTQSLHSKVKAILSLS